MNTLKQLKNILLKDMQESGIIHLTNADLVHFIDRTIERDNNHADQLMGLAGDNTDSVHTLLSPSSIIQGDTELELTITDNTSKIKDEVMTALFIDLTNHVAPYFGVDKNGDGSIERLYTKEEVIKLCTEAYTDGRNDSVFIKDTDLDSIIDNWVNTKIK